MSKRFLAVLAAALLVSLIGVAPGNNLASAAGDGHGKVCNDSNDVIVIINPVTGEEIEFQLNHDDCVKFHNKPTIDTLAKFCSFLIDTGLSDFESIGQCMQELRP